MKYLSTHNALFLSLSLMLVASLGFVQLHDFFHLVESDQHQADKSEQNLPFDQKNDENCLVCTIHLTAYNVNPVCLSPDYSLPEYLFLPDLIYNTPATNFYIRLRAPPAA